MAAPLLLFCKRAANQTVLHRTTQDDTGQHQTDLHPVQDSIRRHRMIQDGTNTHELENR
jgi:hypothetical protein